MYTYMCIWSNGGYFFSWFPYTICLDKATLSAALLIWYAQKIWISRIWLIIYRCPSSWTALLYLDWSSPSVMCVFNLTMHYSKYALKQIVLGTRTAESSVAEYCKIIDKLFLQQISYCWFLVPVDVVLESALRFRNLSLY